VAAFPDFAGLGWSARGGSELGPSVVVLFLSFRVLSLEFDPLDRLPTRSSPLILPILEVSLRRER
jgi:hypothetical protein